MVLKLNQLELLDLNMQQNQIVRQKIAFSFHNVHFSVIYIADTFPHQLLFGCVAHNIFFVLDVNRNYEIDTYLGPHYQTLINALGFNNGKGNALKSNDFFSQFDRRIPLTAHINNNPTLAEIAALSRDVEEPDKIYFVGWLTHDGVHYNVSATNLQKTLRLCGPTAHALCQQLNISSRWSDIGALQKTLTTPGT